MSMSLLSAMLISCGLKIPTEAMGNAKLAIAKAESVMADKYAKEKYLGARKALLDTHELISKEEDYEDIEKKAKEAEKLANEAFAISAPKLAQDTKNEAVKSTARADEAYAEEFAADDFQNAKASMKEGDKLYNEKKYVEAFKKYEESREVAKKARNISEAQSETMKNDISDVEATITEAEKYGATSENSSSLADAKKKVNSAKVNVKAVKLKVASGEIKEAKSAATKAKEGALKKWASDKHIEASDKVKQAGDNLTALTEKIDNELTKKALERSPEAKDSIQSTIDTLTAAKDALSASKRALNDKTYHDSHTQSEEAIRLASIVENQIPQNMVLVTQAIADYNAYLEGLEKLAKEKKDQKEADRLAALQKKNRDWGKMLLEARKGWKSYRVRYIPKNRDCLWKIAAYRKHYGKAKLWPRIYKANKHQIKNPDLIYPNQVFDIPPRSGVIMKPTIESLKKKYDEDNGKEINNDKTDDNKTIKDTVDKELDGDDTINDDTIDADQ